MTSTTFTHSYLGSKQTISCLMWWELKHAVNGCARVCQCWNLKIYLLLPSSLSGSLQAREMRKNVETFEFQKEKQSNSPMRRSSSWRQSTASLVLWSGRPSRCRALWTALLKGRRRRINARGRVNCGDNSAKMKAEIVHDQKNLGKKQVVLT